MRSVASVSLSAETPTDLEVLVELADFWKLPYSTSYNAGSHQLLICSGTLEDGIIHEEETAIIIPSKPEGFQHLAAQYETRAVPRQHTVRVPVAPGASAAIKTTVTELQGSRIEPLLTANGVTLLSGIRGTGTKLASLDIVSEYRRHMHEGLEDDSSRLFRIVSSIPTSYGLIPPRLRNWSLKHTLPAAKTHDEEIAPVECLRTIFLSSILRASDCPVPTIGFWGKGTRYVVSITHDVESRRGLESGTRNILQVEDKLGIQSTWNLPSDRYEIPKMRLRNLARHGEIGAHDTRHDGRLILVSLEKKTQRAAKCKQGLEVAGQTSVVGFRSPLLQHSRELLEAVERAGYEYDSSVPSLEPLSPTSLKPHGIGTIFPLKIGGIIEIPVTLPQDHQCFRILGLSPRETVDLLLHLSTWIRMIGGACVILIHPDYEFGMPENESEYARLLKRFSNDPECKIMKMRDIARWWRKRSEAYIDISDGEPKIRSRRDGTFIEDLDLQIVSGYGVNGFEFQDNDQVTADSTNPLLAG